MRQEVQAFDEPHLHRLLAGPGLFVRMAPFVMHIRSSIPVVAQGLHRLYGRHECWTEPGRFADFRVMVRVRRPWLRPLCEFQLDGLKPFTPLAVGEAFALLEWGMNWCITGHCHQWVILHAAVLERGGRAVILPAPPGSGKSTLCAALMGAGWRLLSDELTLIDPDTGWLIPSPRPISLKNASIDVIRQRLPHWPMGPVARDTLKGTVCHLRASDDSTLRAEERARPAWVIFPKYDRECSLDVRARGKSDALLELQRNAFNRHVHGHAGFHAVADVLDACDVFDLRYGDLDRALAFFESLHAHA